MVAFNVGDMCMAPYTDPADGSSGCVPIVCSIATAKCMHTIRMRDTTPHYKLRVCLCPDGGGGFFFLRWGEAEIFFFFILFFDFGVATCAHPARAHHRLTYRWHRGMLLFHAALRCAYAGTIPQR